MTLDPDQVFSGSTARPVDDKCLAEVLRTGEIPPALGREQVIGALIGAGFVGWCAERPDSRLASHLVSELLRQYSDGRLTPVECLAGLAALRNGAMMRARLLRVLGEVEEWLDSAAAWQAGVHEYEQLMHSVHSLFEPSDLEARRLSIAEHRRRAQEAVLEQAQQLERRRQREAEQMARERALALERLVAKEREDQERARQDAARQQEQKLVAACGRLAGLFITSDGERTRVPLSTLRLEDNDIRLVLKWLNIPEPSQRSLLDRQVFPATLSNWLATTFGDESDMARLTAARLAEKAAAQFYAEAGETVEDVSIEQLLPATTRWKSFDLLVNGRAIDVKHARESWSRPNAYTEHCVPRFKEERSKPVIIAGVFSRAVSLQQLQTPAYAPAEAAFIVLGETTETEIARIAGYFREESRLTIDVTRLRNGKSFIPCWAFDSEVRVRWNNSEGAGVRISQDLQLTVSHGARGGINPAAIGWLLFEPLPAYLTDGLSNEHRKFLQRASAARASAGLSLPIVYLLVLTEILAALSRRELSLEYIRQCIFVGHDDDQWQTRRWPLGVWDPLNSVLSLVEAFERAIQQNAKWLHDFREYRLTGLNVLRGLDRKGQWITVLAYCGGWDQDVECVYHLSEKEIGEWKPGPGEYRDGQNVYKVRNVEKCGETPLVLGSSEPCQCGKLICPSCGCCQWGCPACAERQFQHALRESPAERRDRCQASDGPRRSRDRPARGESFEDDIPF